MSIKNVLSDHIPQILVGSTIISFSLVLAGLLNISYILILIISLSATGLFYARNDLRIILFGLLITRMTIDVTSTFLTIPISSTVALTLSQLFGLIVFILGSSILIRQYTRITLPPLAWAFVILILYSALSFFISVSPSPLTTTLYEVLRIINILIIYIIAFFTITTREHFHTLLTVLLVGSSIPIVVALYQLVAGIGYTDIAFDAARVFGTFTHPNIFSTYLVAMIAVSTMLYVYTTNKTVQLFAASASIIYAVMIFATFSRVSWIALFIFVGIVTLLKYRKVIPFVVILPLLMYITIPAFSERIDEALRPGVDSSITWRINLWNDTIYRTISDGRAVYGNGINTFDVVAEGIRGNRFGSTDPHNEYVRSFVEGGWIGLGIFLLLTLSVIILIFAQYIKTKDIQQKHVYLILFALTIALAAASMTDHIFRSTPLQWILFALLGGALAVTQNKK